MVWPKEKKKNILRLSVAVGKKSHIPYQIIKDYL